MKLIDGFESEVIAFNRQTLVDYCHRKHPHQPQSRIAFSNAIMPMTGQQELETDNEASYQESRLHVAAKNASNLLSNLQIHQQDMVLKFVFFVVMGSFAILGLLLFESMGRIVLYVGIGIFTISFTLLLTQHKWNKAKIGPDESDAVIDDNYIPQPGEFFKYKVYQSSYYVHLRNSFLLRPEYKNLCSVDEIISGSVLEEDRFFNDPDVIFNFDDITEDDLNEALGVKKVRSKVKALGAINAFKKKGQFKTSHQVHHHHDYLKNDDAYDDRFLDPEDEEDFYDESDVYDTTYSRGTEILSPEENSGFYVDTYDGEYENDVYDEYDTSPQLEIHVESSPEASPSAERTPSEKEMYQMQLETQDDDFEASFEIEEGEEEGEGKKKGAFFTDAEEEDHHHYYHHQQMRTDAAAADYDDDGGDIFLDKEDSFEMQKEEEVNNIQQHIEEELGNMKDFEHEKDAVLGDLQCLVVIEEQTHANSVQDKPQLNEDTATDGDFVDEEEEEQVESDKRPETLSPHSDLNSDDDNYENNDEDGYSSYGSEDIDHDNKNENIKERNDATAAKMEGDDILIERYEAELAQANNASPERLIRSDAGSAVAVLNYNSVNTDKDKDTSVEVGMTDTENLISIERPLPNEASTAWAE